MKVRTWQLAPLVFALGAGLSGCGTKEEDQSEPDDSVEPAPDDPEEELIEDCRVLGECELEAPLDRTVATTVAEAALYLYTGDDPLQRDVDEGAIDPQRVAILRGEVQDVDGEPLLGARISIVGHPELGWTYSRADGTFAMAVNGGGRLVVSYRKLGHLGAQRSVQPGWQRYESLPLVGLAPKSNKASDISADGGGLQVAEGESYEDREGEHQPLVLFESGTEADAVLADGSREQLAAMTVRVSEYPFEEAGEGDDDAPRFSAGTPSTSGLSYSLGFSVDEAEAPGAQSVEFSKPVTLYVENFLELETGSEIPFGYYNPSSGSWEQESPMVVVEIVDEVNGSAVLDADGDGEADSEEDLEDLHLSAEELHTVAERYEPGDTLWRARVRHFSQYQGEFPVVPPPTAAAPAVVTPNVRPLASTTRRGAARVEDQTVAQSVPLHGTPYSLYYQSDRTASFGAAHQIEVPLIGEEVPEQLVDVKVVVKIAGQTLKRSFDPEANLSHTFEWDGRDGEGRLVQGQQRAKVTVRYRYPGEIRVSKRNRAGWGRASARNGGRYSVLKQVIELPVGSWDAGGYEMGGFGLDVLHAYDPVHHTLHFGDGDNKYAENVALVVDLPAANDDLGEPDSIVIAPDGSAILSDDVGRRLLRVSPDETVTVLAGPGASGEAGDIDLSSPQGVAQKSDGSVWVSDFDTGKVWEITPDGEVNCIIGDRGDNPRVVADFDSIEGIAFGPSEELYLVGRPSVYRLRGDTLELFAGGGEADGVDIGDGGPATEAFLEVPSGVVAAPDGTVYISERDGDRIRKVLPNGNIFTYVGTGEGGFSGDGELAANAQIDQPRGLALGPDGTLYFSDRNNGRVRMVSPEGRIQTLAGGGDEPLEPGKLSTFINIEFPDGLAVGQDGAIWSSAESGLYRIRPGTPDLKKGGNLVPSQDGRTLYKFDARGKHLATIDAMTAVTMAEFSYNNQGLLTSITDRNCLVTTIERAGSGQARKVIGPFGHETVLARDGARLTQITDPIGRVTEFQYDEENDLLKAAIDPKGKATEFEYDTNDRLISVTDPTGYVERYDRSKVPGGHSVAVSTPTEKTMEFLVQSSGGMTQERSIINFDGTTQTMSDDIMSQTLYSPDGTSHFTALSADPQFGAQSVYASIMETATPGGRTLSVYPTRMKQVDDLENALSVNEWSEVVEVNGRFYESVYNRADRTLTLKTPEGRQTVTEFDEAGRPISRKRSGITKRSWRYDELGQPTLMRRGSAASGRDTTLEWNESGFVGASENALGERTGYGLDLVGRIESRTRPDGLQVLSTWDDDDSILSIQAPERAPHTFDYFDGGLLETSTPPDIGGQAVGQVTYDYNDDYQLAAIRNADGRSIEFTYDFAGRLDKTDLGSVRIDNDFDEFGRIVRATRTGGPTVRRSFDGPLWLGDRWGNGRSVVLDYDDNFWVSSITVNGSLTSHFQYDNDGLLTQARVLTNELNLTRDTQTGFITATSLSDVDTSSDYNKYGELRSLGTATSALDFSQTLRRDALGRVTEITETIDGFESVTTFSYDALGQLVEYEKDGDVYSYTYDANGNRLSYETPEGVLYEGVYDEQDRIHSWDEWTYSYTEQGDLVQRTNGDLGLTLQYDELGNLLRADIESADASLGIDYQVDAMGRRMSRVTTDGDEHYWVYQDALRPVGEVANGIFTQYVYANDGVGGAPDFMVRSGVPYRLIKDHMGSVRFVVNANTGAVSQELEYDPFGRVLVDTNPGFQPFGFAGGLYDWDTKLVRFGARDYDPGVGRWTAKDLIGFAGGQENVYVYSGSDPVNFIDPTGKLVWIPAAIAFAAVMLATSDEEAYVAAGTSVAGGVFANTLGPIGRFLVGPGAARGLGFGASDLVLGLNRNGALKTWAARYGGNTYDAFTANLPSGLGFPGQIRHAMDRAKKIRFNLDGVDVSRASGELNEFGEPFSGNYTNYELFLIKTTPEYLEKAAFYRSGQRVPSPF